MSVLTEVNFNTLYKNIHLGEYQPLMSGYKRNARYSIRDIRKILNDVYSSHRPLKTSNTVIMDFHFKGGVGKTAFSVAISVLLSLLNKKVLLVDADQQGHASISLGFTHSQKHLTLLDGLKNKLTPQNLILPVFEGLDCIPANLSLGGIDHFLYKVNEDDRHKILEEYMGSLRQDYDFIIFDTPPNLTDLNRCIFYFSDMINMVNDLMPESVNSISYILPELEDTYKKYSKNFPELLIIPNLYEDRVSSCLEAMTILKNNWGKFMIPDFAIRKSEDFPKAFKEQMPLPFFCKVNSIAFEDMSVVIRELIRRLSDIQVV